MGDVSVIGTGAMGSALVEVLASSGAEVMVWNRTRAKAAALAGPRVRLADSVTEALRSSPLTIVAVSDHEVARTLVEGSAQDLAGKVVASTSFVTPDQAHAFDAVVAAAGGAYLDLEIIAGPTPVRSGAGVVLVSGDRTAYEAHRGRFERIGHCTYVSEIPASAYISGMAILVAYLPMAVGLLQGVRIAATQDLSEDRFRETVLEVYPSQIEQLLDQVIARSDPATTGPEATVDVMATWAAEYGAALREMGLDHGMYDALDRLFDAASAAGDGAADWTCIAEHVAAHPG